MKKILFVLFLVIGISFLQGELVAQCPMCSMAAESNLKAGGAAGRGLNIGILYLYILPYLVTATLGILWYKNQRKRVAS